MIDRALADGYWARARAVWAAAAAALARGDRETFARQAGEAAMLAAASGAGVTAGGLARLRAGLLALPVEPGSATETFAAALRRGPATASPAPAGSAMWLRYLRALAGELPANHPLIETATEDALGSETLELVIAVLSSGPAGATAAMLARWLGATRDDIERRAGAASALVAIGTLRWRDDRVRANPLLWAACVGEPSPLELPPSRWPSAPVAGADAASTVAAPAASTVAAPAGAIAAAAASTVAAGLRIATAPTPALARAAMAATSPPLLLAPAGIAGARWAARDARWRSRTLAIELDAPPVAEILELLIAAPRVLVLTDDRTASWLAANVGAARPVRVEAVRPLAPAVAAATIAGVLGIPASSLALGHLYAGDLDDLLGGIEVRGEPAAWALGHALRDRAAAALGDLAITAEQAARTAPPPAPGLGPSAGSVAPLLERVREIFAGANAWAAPPTAVTVTGAPDLAPRLAAELATERGLAAADIALDAPHAWHDVTLAIAAIRRFGGVLAIRGLAGADDIRVRALAYALQRAQITTIIGLSPGADLPAPLRTLATQL